MWLYVGRIIIKKTFNRFRYYKLQPHKHKNLPLNNNSVN